WPRRRRGGQIPRGRRAPYSGRNSAMDARNRAFLLPPGTRRVVGELVTALLLMPMPALALTHLRSRHALTPLVGHPTPPTPVVTDSVSGQKDTLLVDMGVYTPSTATQTASSQVVLTRQVEIDKASQAIEFTHNFAGLFAYAGYNVTVQVKDSSGKVV